MQYLVISLACLLLLRLLVGSFCRAEAIRLGSVACDVIAGVAMIAGEAIFESGCRRVRLPYLLASAMRTFP